MAGLGGFLAGGGTGGKEEGGGAAVPAGKSRSEVSLGAPSPPWPSSVLLSPPLPLPTCIPSPGPVLCPTRAFPAPSPLLPGTGAPCKMPLGVYQTPTVHGVVERHWGWGCFLMGFSYSVST